MTRSLPIVLSLLVIFTISMNTSMAQEIIPLYDGKIPNSKTTPDREWSELWNGVTIVHDITRPTLSIYHASVPGVRPAVVIIPGGGYGVNAIVHEGTDVAKELNRLGITAFVLKYRIPSDETMNDPEIGPLQDAQQAIKIVREHAVEWNVDPNRIGILGFSAGGHLAATAGVRFDQPVISNEKKISLRPDFMILIYPVISFLDDVGHMGSRERLIGPNPSKEKIDYYSNEKHITSSTPPTILIHASDDDAVKPENSILFYQGLIHNNIKAELHIYQGGGHGFGLNNPTTKELWMDRCANWMSANGWLKK